MKTLLSTIAILAVSATAAFAAPSASEGLKTLAQTGWANVYASEIGGVAYDEIGGNPAAFEYAVATPWQAAANEFLNEGEFLAPHFAHKDGIITIMVAPHLFVDGMLMKGANVEKDSFIVINSDGKNGVRYDYSEDAK